VSGPFEPGDVVVCVDAGIIHCAGNTRHRGLYFTKGYVGRVVGVRPTMPGLKYGRICGCTALVLADGKSGHINRFRKIDDEVTDEFREQLRKLPVLEPAL
jgi:hypothetical protein